LLMLDASTAVDWGGRARADEPEQRRAEQSKEGLRLESAGEVSSWLCWLGWWWSLELLVLLLVLLLLLLLRMLACLCCRLEKRRRARGLGSVGAGCSGWAWGAAARGTREGGGGGQGRGFAAGAGDLLPCKNAVNLSWLFRAVGLAIGWTPWCCGQSQRWKGLDGVA
jgi:hypothetical protein